MIIHSKVVKSKDLTWVIRSARKEDAKELSRLRYKIDGQTEFMAREQGEGVLSKEEFEEMIHEDSTAGKSIFLVAEAKGRIVGFARCIGSTLARFKHKAEFGICIEKEFWGYSIGPIMLEYIINWAEAIGIKKISLDVVEDNVKAIAMYRKFGFVEEGLLIKDRIHKDGSYHNTVMMSRFI